jgi:hypothetical protein
MQTFLPYAHFSTSAKFLDNKRLGKQRVEVLQLLRGQFPNHPCHLGWRHNREALAAYGIRICQEWISRGFKDTCLAKIDAEVNGMFDNGNDKTLLTNTEDGLFLRWGEIYPYFKSHQMALLRKDVDFYGPQLIKYGGHAWVTVEELTLPYLWPVVTKVEFEGCGYYEVTLQEGRPLTREEKHFSAYDYSKWRLNKVTHVVP